LCGPEKTKTQSCFVRTRKIPASKGPRKLKPRRKRTYRLAFPKDSFLGKMTWAGFFPKQNDMGNGFIISQHPMYLFSHERDFGNHSFILQFSAYRSYPLIFWKPCTHKLHMLQNSTPLSSKKFIILDTSWVKLPKLLLSIYLKNWVGSMVLITTDVHWSIEKSSTMLSTHLSIF
jgi:hypothetical protein